MREAGGREGGRRREEERGGDPPTHPPLLSLCLFLSLSPCLSWYLPLSLNRLGITSNGGQRLWKPKALWIFGNQLSDGIWRPRLPGSPSDWCPGVDPVRMYIELINIKVFWHIQHMYAAGIGSIGER